MNYILGNAVVGIPALLGVLLGLKIFVSGSDWLFATALMIALAALSTSIGCRLLATRPRLGRWLIEVWILSAVGVTALATALIITIGLAPPLGWLGDLSTLDAEALKSVSGALLGAISAFVALAWTKDIGDAKGLFWPSTQFKAGLADAYKRLRPPPAGGTTVFEAIFEDVVTGEGDLGWGFSARARRAEILAGYL